MKCRKCRVEIPDGSKFCLACGVRQEIKQNPKSRGNGQGSVYQLPNKKWIAIKTIGYENDEDGKQRRVTRSKSGFRTKKEALDYLPKITTERRVRAVTFKEVYDAWLPTHRAGKQTMDCYKAAVKHFSPIWNLNITDLTVDDLQECVDECPRGKQTKKNMKTLCKLIYDYAIPRKLTTLNMGPYLKVTAEDGSEKKALPTGAVKTLEKNLGKVPGADYVFCQCYLGFRPQEFLALDVGSYNEKEHAFVGGAKTDAGKNRTVTISPKIQPIIDRLMKGKKEGQVFCSLNGGGTLSLGGYRKLFYDVLDDCGIENPIIERDGVQYHTYTPHSCRHTFATMVKRVAGADKDKLELIGHTDVEMLMYYQDVEFADLRKITDALE